MAPPRLMPSSLREAGKTVVDLSADFRTTDPAVYREFYGQDHPAPACWPRRFTAFRKSIANGSSRRGLIAVPGCFPTSIILPLAPFLRAGLVEPDSIVVTSLSGVSGAGRKLELRLLFGEVNDNMYPTGCPSTGIWGKSNRNFRSPPAKRSPSRFVPHLVPIHRGMLSTITARLTRPLTDAEATGRAAGSLWREPFVEVLEAPALPESRQVANSNRIQMRRGSTPAPTGCCSFRPSTILAKAMLPRPFSRPTWPAAWMKHWVWMKTTKKWKPRHQGRRCHLRPGVSGRGGGLRNQAAR
jgi:N-acetyl-gamma-glutamyl-phosphate reductase